MPYNLIRIYSSWPQVLTSIWQVFVEYVPRLVAARSLLPLCIVAAAEVSPEEATSPLEGPEREGYRPDCPRQTTSPTSGRQRTSTDRSRVSGFGVVSHRTGRKRYRNKLGWNCIVGLWMKRWSWLQPQMIWMIPLYLEKKLKKKDFIGSKTWMIFVEYVIHYDSREHARNSRLRKKSLVEAMEGRLETLQQEVQSTLSLKLCYRSS